MIVRTSEADVFCKCNLCGREIRVPRGEFMLSRESLNLLNCDDCTYKVYQRALEMERHTALLGRRKDAGRLLAAANIPERYHQFDTTKIIRAVADWLSAARNVVLTGESFSGKTLHVCYALAQQIVENGRSVAYFSSLAEFHAAYSSSRNEFARYVSSKDFICIDDLSRYRLTEAMREDVFALVDRAYNGTLKPCLWLVGDMARGELDNFGYGVALRNRLRHAFDSRAIVGGELLPVSV